MQTGKAQPAPLVLLDVPDGTYWKGWQTFVDREVASRGLVSPDDHALYKVTSDVDEAAAEMLGFYRNYHSCRWVGDLLVIRLNVAPDRGQLADLNRQFADIVMRHYGSVQPGVVTGEYRMHYGRLRALIDALNALVS